MLLVVRYSDKHLSHAELLKLSTFSPFLSRSLFLSMHIRGKGLADLRHQKLSGILTGCKFRQPELNGCLYERIRVVVTKLLLVLNCYCKKYVQLTTKAPSSRLDNQTTLTFS